MKKLWDKKFKQAVGIHANDTPKRALPMLLDKIPQDFSFLDNGIKS
jgi:hypothetical protein